MMPGIILDTTDAASHVTAQAFGVASSELDRPPKFLRESRLAGEMLIPNWRSPRDPGTLREANPPTFAEIEFWNQKQAFLALPPAVLRPYVDQFVIAHNGQILDHDPNLQVLTSRFFRQVGDLPVYITRIGGDLEVRIDTPFFD